MKIIFTSDIHSCLFPTDYVSEGELAMGAYAVASSFLHDADTLVIDGGDFLQGSVLSKYVNDHQLLHPLPQAVAAKAMGMDIFVPGNHDFNHGYEMFRAFSEQCGAKILCCNLEDRTGAIEILPHLLVTDASGLRIGFTGALTDYLKVWERPENLENFFIKDARASLERELQYLKSHADVTVLVYHGGFECDLKTGGRQSDTRENIGYEIASELDFDLILSGHQHRHIDLCRVKNSLVLQNDPFGASFAELFVSREGITGGLKRPHIPSLSMGSVMEKFEKDMNLWLNSVVGHLEEPLPQLTHLEAFSKGSPFADIVNTIQLRLTGADISATALGNELYAFDRDVSIVQVIASYRYPNTLEVLEVGEEELKEALEVSASFLEVENGKFVLSQKHLEPKVDFYNYDYYLGLDYEFDISQPVGKRVSKLMFQGSPLGDRKLKLVVNSYRSSGSGGYEVFLRCKKLAHLEEDVQDLILQYFLSFGSGTAVWDKASFHLKAL